MIVARNEQPLTNAVIDKRIQDFKDAMNLVAESMGALASKHDPLNDVDFSDSLVSLANVQTELSLQLAAHASLLIVGEDAA